MNTQVSNTCSTGSVGGGGGDVGGGSSAVSTTTTTTTTNVGLVDFNDARAPRSPLVGYDPVDWVRQVVLPRIKRTPDNTRYLYPDPLPAFRTYSQMHSWYKHFRATPGQLFPMLRIGRDKQCLIFDKDDEALPKDDSLNWTFVELHHLLDYEDGTGFCSGFQSARMPWQIMHDCYFFVSHLYSQFSLYKGNVQYDASALSARCMLLQCALVRERITRILLAIDPNPPTMQPLVHDARVDGHVSQGTAWHERVVIAGKLYEFADGEQIAWRQQADHCATPFVTESIHYYYDGDDDDDAPDCSTDL